jgi:hypothetical protein
MRSRKASFVLMAGLALAFIFTALATGGQRAAAAGTDVDPLTGDWNATFTIAGQSVQVKLNFKLDGQQVTGTVVSAHTGAGTVKGGEWKDKKLTFTANFDQHESIAMTGHLADGKLVGTFATEGMEGTWTADKK